MSQKNHLTDTLFLQPSEPGADFFYGIFMFMRMGCGAIVGAMTVIQPQTQIDSQRTHSVFQKQFLKSSDEFTLVMRERAVGDQNCRAGWPISCLLQIGIQGQCLLLQVHLL